MRLARHAGTAAGCPTAIRRPPAGALPARRVRSARAAAAARDAPAAAAAAAECSNSSSNSSRSSRSSSSSSSSSSRRAVLAAAPLAIAAAAAAPAARAEGPLSALEPMDALKGKDYGKPRMKYGDFVTTPSGLQVLDVREGAGAAPERGQTAVVDWAGFTIGYYGRPFEARNKPKGSSFTGENKDFYRFRLGTGQVIPGFDEAVAGMKVGGIRRVIVPVELGYPNGDFKKTGPRPSTFAGERALDFVLSNRGMVDKTLLFDIELLRIQQ